VAPAPRRQVVPVVLVVGSDELAERCRVAVGDVTVVVASAAGDMRFAATAWLPKVVVCTLATYSTDPADIEATVRRIRARLVKVVDDDAPYTELVDRIAGSMGISGTRRRT
jgi:hypothetical protein